MTLKQNIILHSKRSCWALVMWDVRPRVIKFTLHPGLHALIKSEIQADSEATHFTMEVVHLESGLSRPRKHRNISQTGGPDLHTTYHCYLTVSPQQRVTCDPLKEKENT